MEGDNRELFYLDAVIHHEMTQRKGKGVRRVKERKR